MAFALMASVPVPAWTAITNGGGQVRAVLDSFLSAFLWEEPGTLWTGWLLPMIGLVWLLRVLNEDYFDFAARPWVGVLADLVIGVALPVNSGTLRTLHMIRSRFQRRMQHVPHIYCRFSVAWVRRRSTHGCMDIPCRSIGSETPWLASGIGLGISRCGFNRSWLRVRAAWRFDSGSPDPIPRILSWYHRTDQDRYEQ